MSELKIHFERLMELAKARNFHKPFSKVYFVESNFIESSEDSNIIQKTNLFTFEDYENSFSKILNSGNSWINICLLGFWNDSLIVSIEIPNYENNCSLTTVNYSLPTNKIIENNWQIFPLYKVIN